MREPTLLDMEARLHDRIEVSTDPYLKLPKQNQHHSKQGYKCNNTGVHTTGINSKKESKPFERKFILCEKKHIIYKCQRYKAMNDLEKFNTIKANKLCCNCFQGDHFTSKCK